MKRIFDKKPLEFTRRVQFKLVAAFFALIVALLILLNTYPVAASRDIVFSEKQSSMLEQANVIAASLSGLDTLTGDGAALVHEYLGDRAMKSVLAAGPALHQNAWGVCMAALDKPAEDAGALLPVYLRLSQAERERQARMSR